MNIQDIQKNSSFISTDQIEQTIDNINNNFVNLCSLIGEANLLIQKFKEQQLQRLDFTFELSLFINDLEKWIQQGIKIAQKMKSINLVQVQQQQNIDQSLQQKQSLSFDCKIIQLNEIDQFIQKLDFLSGAEFLDQNYVDAAENQNTFRQEFRVQELDLEQKCKSIIGYQNVYQDGNSFYTAFFYQYLRILLQELQKPDSIQKINDFIRKVSELKLRIFYNYEFSISVQLEIEIKSYFKKVLKEIINNPQNLLQYFSKHNKKFYTCSIIIFRNIIYQMSQKDEEILNWQQEFNKNKTLIGDIFNKFDLQATIYCSQKNNFEVEIYNQQQNSSQINFLFASGHYQIIICQSENFFYD